MNIKVKLDSRFSISTLLAGSAIAASAAFAGELDVIDHATEIPVTIDNFVRAATDIEMDKYVSIAGGSNKFVHIVKPTPIDQQPTIRMNRDTLYSSAVVDISQGATLTMPDAGGRYMSTMVVNQDHFVNKVFHGGGTFELDMDTYDTPFVILITRILVDSEDPEDVKAVNALQDQMKIESRNGQSFVVPNYDEESFEHILHTTLELARSVPDSFRTFGAKQDVDPLRHFAGTAFGWGGLPEQEAFYLNVEPGLPDGKYKLEVGDVPVDAFWSVSLYNARGFFEENDLGVYSINSVTGLKDDNGMMPVHFGGCEDGRINCLPIMEGWNYAVRMYVPRAEVLDGSWVFPEVTAAD